jgi:preprotein translocase subunit SecA
MSVLDYWYAVGDRFGPRMIDVAPGDRQLVERIQQRADALRQLSSRAVFDAARQLKSQVAAGASIASEAISIEAAALLQAAAHQTLGIALYDVQLLAGLILARGAIAEMHTGEGKTYTAALPAFMQYLAGRPVHIATVNAYLAGRDEQTLRPLLTALGMSVALLPEATPLTAKRQVYACDVVYGTGYEFGFDYLREQLQALSRRIAPLGRQLRSHLRGETSGQTLRGFDRTRAFVLIDEIDSVLIDEACLPLILSDRGSEAVPDAEAHRVAQELVIALIEGEDFLLDRSANKVRLTPQGLKRIHDGRTQAPAGALLRPWATYVEQALYAHWLLRKDIDYVVADQQIWLVDQYTGRIFPDRTWSDGLHQAVEAKEQVPPTAEHHAAARITRQRYFKLYGCMSGMTGTAGLGAREFWDVYRLPVVSIPLRRPSQRVEWPTRYFLDAESKWQAIVAEVAEVHRQGRPVLIGSRTIENSLLLAARLEHADVPFRLLNGKQTEDEAEVIAASGQSDAVTIATNMAGRGTDIRLGPGVEQLGGLHLVGVERHQSRRIDDQLSGRVARQGDRGSARFFMAATDELIARYEPTLAERIRGLPQSAEGSNPELDAKIEALQRRLERRHYQERRRLMSYDHWLDDIRAKLPEG